MSAVTTTPAAIPDQVLKSKAWAVCSQDAKTLLTHLAIAYDGQNNGALDIPAVPTKRSREQVVAELLSRDLLIRTQPAHNGTPGRYAVPWQTIDSWAGRNGHNAPDTWRPIPPQTSTVPLPTPPVAKPIGRPVPIVSSAFLLDDYAALFGHSLGVAEPQAAALALWATQSFLRETPPVLVFSGGSHAARSNALRVLFAVVNNPVLAYWIDAHSFIEKASGNRATVLIDAGDRVVLAQPELSWLVFGMVGRLSGTPPEAWFRGEKRRLNAAVAVALPRVTARLYGHCLVVDLPRKQPQQALPQAALALRATRAAQWAPGNHLEQERLAPRARLLALGESAGERWPLRAAEALRVKRRWRWRYTIPAGDDAGILAHSR